MPRKKGQRNTARTNLKRTKLLQGIAKGMNVSEAGRAAGYGKPQAAHLALNRMRLFLPEILQRMDIPIEKVLRKLSDKLEAKETQFFQSGGVVMEKRTVVAHDIQLRAAIELAKIYGCYPRLGEPVDEDANPVGPAHVTLNLVLPDTRDAKVLVAINTDRGAHHQQPDLDERKHQDPGRARSEPSL